jgi:hypothetical protein
MKTDDLIALVSQDLRPVDPRASGRSYGLVVLIGAAAALLLTRAPIGLPPLVPDYFGEPMLWLKLGFGVAVAAACLWVAAQLGRPGTRPGWSVVSVAVPFIVVWAIALVTLFTTPAAIRGELIWGQTWRSCPGTVALLSVPTLIGALLVLRTMAPTRPMWAGAAAGGLAGGVAATVYSLHCPELAAPFLAVWYVLGVLIPVVVGAVVGRYLLRW